MTRGRYYYFKLIASYLILPWAAYVPSSLLLFGFASETATVLLLLLLSLLLLLLLLPLLQFVFLLELLLLLLLLMLLLLLVGACHPSDTVPPVRVANLHMHKTAA